mmetsp:Transcript_27255/g.73693  ORF Transcript_27255/g.73693 Transcript_27255/m.73693 type:complete len:283 (-) Transcript_27255:744-1592(-)
MVRALEYLVVRLVSFVSFASYFCGGVVGGSGGGRRLGTRRAGGHRGHGHGAQHLADGNAHVLRRRHWRWRGTKTTRIIFSRLILLCVLHHHVHHPPTGRELASRDEVKHGHRCRHRLSRADLPALEKLAACMLRERPLQLAGTHTIAILYILGRIRILEHALEPGLRTVVTDDIGPLLVHYDELATTRLGLICRHQSRYRCRRRCRRLLCLTHTHSVTGRLVGAQPHSRGQSLGSLRRGGGVDFGVSGAVPPRAQPKPRLGLRDRLVELLLLTLHVFLRLLQ